MKIVKITGNLYNQNLQEFKNCIVLDDVTVYPVYITSSGTTWGMPTEDFESFKEAYTEQSRKPVTIPTSALSEFVFNDCNNITINKGETK